MKWQYHYTGIEIWNPAGNGEGWYVQRDATEHSHRVTFIRYSRNFFQYAPHKWVFRIFVVLFLGYLNHLKTSGGNWGFELATNNIRIGLALPEHWSGFHRRNPSVKIPPRKFFAFWRDSRNVAFRMGWLLFGCTSPKFIRRMFDRIDQKRWEAEAAAYEAYLKANGFDQEEPDHEPNESGFSIGGHYNDLDPMGTYMGRNE